MKRFERLERGFTLMELMVVIVIVAILAAVAVPLYINYVNDARDTEAKGAIGAVITAEQAYHQQNGNYVAMATGDFIANPTPGSQNGLNCDITDALHNWTFQVTLQGTTGFTATATGTGTTNGPKTTHHVTFVYPTSAQGGGWSTTDQ